MSLQLIYSGVNTCITIFHAVKIYNTVHVLLWFNDNFHYDPYHSFFYNGHPLGRNSQGKPSIRTIVLYTVLRLTGRLKEMVYIDSGKPKQSILQLYFSHRICSSWFYLIVLLPCSTKNKVDGWLESVCHCRNVVMSLLWDFCECTAYTVYRINYLQSTVGCYKKSSWLHIPYSYMSKYYCT